MFWYGVICSYFEKKLKALFQGKFCRSIFPEFVQSEPLMVSFISVLILNFACAQKMKKSKATLKDFFFLIRKADVWSNTNTNKVTKTNKTNIWQLFQNQKTFLSRQCETQGACSEKHTVRWQYAACEARGSWNSNTTQGHNKRKTSQSQWIPRWTTYSPTVGLWVCLFWLFSAFWGFATQGPNWTVEQSKAAIKLICKAMLTLTHPGSAVPQLQ